MELLHQIECNWYGLANPSHVQRIFFLASEIALQPRIPILRHPHIMHDNLNTRATNKKKAQRARHAGDRRPVPERAHDQRLGARMARRRGTQRPSGPRVGLTAPALQEANTHRLFIKLWCAPMASARTAP